MLKHNPCSWPVPQTQSVPSHVQLASALNTIRAVPCSVGQYLKHNPCSPCCSVGQCLKHNPCSPMFSWPVPQTQSVQSHVHCSVGQCLKHNPCSPKLFSWPVPQTQSVQSDVQLVSASKTIRALSCCSVGHLPQTQPVQSHVQFGQCFKHNPCSPMFSWPVPQTQSVQSHVQLVSGSASLAPQL